MFPREKSEITAIFTLCILFVAVMLFAWIGYYGSDDMSYYSGARGWLDDFPYVGQDHWTLRHTIVIPTALLFATFGVSEVTLVLPVLLYYAGILIVVYAMVRNFFDFRTAFLSVFLIITLPLMATQSTVVVPDFAETFFCLLSLYLFLKAAEYDNPNTSLFLAGVLLGLAWLTRETVVFVVAAYGLLFLFGFAHARWRYFIMAAGMLVIIGIEFAYFGIVAGNPLHRIYVDLGTHLNVDASAGLTAVGDGIERAVERTEDIDYGTLKRTGNISVTRFLDPLLVVIANQEFVAFYFLVVPGAILAFLQQGRSRRQRSFIVAISAIGAVWFAVLFMQIGMTLLPRYYMIPSVALAILFSVWFVNRFWDTRPVLVALVMLAFLMNGFVGIYVDNRDPLFAERELVKLAVQSDRAIATDPETFRRGSFLYETAGVKERVVEGIQPGYCLYFHNPRYVDHGFMLGMTQAERDSKLDALSAHKPRDEWTEVEQIRPDDRAIGTVLKALHLDSVIPPEIFRRLVSPNYPVTLYETCR